MGEPRLPAQDLGREMPAEEAAQIRQLLGRQEDELEGRQCIALRQLEEALQVLGAVGTEARRRERSRGAALNANLASPAGDGRDAALKPVLLPVDLMADAGFEGPVLAGADARRGSDEPADA